MFGNKGQPLRRILLHRITPRQAMRRFQGTFFFILLSIWKSRERN